MPATVSADPLPTVQQNGVIWAQVTVGNIVYAAGSFTQTWPAGSTNTSANDTARSNLLAYDITTGKLTSFNFALDQQALAIAASPDGTHLYVGGDFTTVNGVSRPHFATFDIGSNQPNGGVLSSVAPSVSNEVSALAVSPDGATVYLGGNFFAVNGVGRTRLAAITSGGALTSWAPSADDDEVTALVVTPDNSEVVVGGRFSTMNNGFAAPGLGAVTTSTGAAVPYAINQYVRDYTGGKSGAGAGIESLATDGTQIYGSGFSYYAGNFEGTFGVDPDTGKVNFINDCHGDTFSVMPVGKVLYTVSHAHDCTAIGDFPDTNGTAWHKALAFTTSAYGTNKGPDSYGWDYNGQPDSQLLHWYPTLADGSYTKQYQAAWSVTGNSKYIALGGEFPSVDGVQQQGIVRYAITSIAPNKTGPIPSTGITPTATSSASGTASVSWQTTWDEDSENLTYKVLRDGSSTPVYTVTQASNFWQLPKLNFLDSGLAPGSSHTYRVQVFDASGNAIGSESSSPVTISSAPTQPAPTDNYGKTVYSDNPLIDWRVNDATGSTSAVDTSVNHDNGVVSGGVTFQQSSPVTTSGLAAKFDGSTGLIASTKVYNNPTVYSEELWFDTTTTNGGKLIGFGDSQTGNSANYDRHVYMLNSGQLEFGTYTGVANTVISPKSYNDGKWHHLVATQGPHGMNVYLDGQLVGSNAVTGAQNFAGYWRVGGDGTWGGANSNYFAGTIDEVAVYGTELTPSQVLSHYQASAAAVSQPPTARIATPSCSNLACSFDGNGSSTSNGSISRYSWDFGDSSTTATTAAPNHTYAAAGTYTVKLTVTDSNGKTGTASTTVTVKAAPKSPTASFTASCPSLTCSFDASGTGTPSGAAITKYAWTFGNGNTGTGVTTSQTYASAGSYSVTLTVTDANGLTGTTTKTVNPAPPGSKPYATDTFNRTTTSGWGSADTGGAWTAIGSSANLSVSNGVGSLTMPKPGSNPGVYLANLSSSDTNTSATITTSAALSGNGAYVEVVGRQIDPNNQYVGRIVLNPDGTIDIAVLTVSAGNETVLKATTLSGVAYKPGVQLAVQLLVTGTSPTTVAMKVWQVGTTQPSTWQLSTTDSTAGLQTAGTVGFDAYLAGNATVSPMAARISSFSTGPSA